MKKHVECLCALTVTAMAIWHIMPLAHDVRLHGLQQCSSCAQVHELPQSDCDNNREGTLFS